MPFYYEFDDVIKKNLSANQNRDKAKDKNVCLIERCKNINKGEKNK